MRNSTASAPFGPGSERSIDSWNLVLSIARSASSDSTRFSNSDDACRLTAVNSAQMSESRSSISATRPESSADLSSALVRSSSLPVRSAA